MGSGRRSRAWREERGGHPPGGLIGTVERRLNTPTLPESPRPQQRLRMYAASPNCAPSTLQWAWSTLSAPRHSFFSLWRLSLRPSWSFAAAVAYSLTSPALVLTPNGPFSFPALWSTERLYLIYAWDELPHMAALALWPVAVLCLFRVLETQRWKWIAAGAFLTAALVYASAFGATLMVLSAACLLAASTFSRSGLVALAVTGSLGYLASCVALPPSLIGLIQTAAKAAGHGWSAKSWTALALVALVWTLLLPWRTRTSASSYSSASRPSWWSASTNTSAVSSFRSRDATSLSFRSP